jgi:hypothetical protein
LLKQASFFHLGGAVRRWNVWDFSSTRLKRGFFRARGADGELKLASFFGREGIDFAPERLEFFIYTP